jgi:hypothetical protein
MKRDMDLVRKILFQVEKQDEPEDLVLSLEGYADEVVAHHIFLMGEAGLLSVTDTSSRGYPLPTAIANYITWKGHEFLDVARSDTLWEKVKKKVKDSLPSVSYEVLSNLLKEEAISLFLG